MAIKSPCYNCDDRYAGCHSICEKYRQFKTRRNKLSETIARTKYQSWGISYDAEYERNKEGKGETNAHK